VPLQNRVTPRGDIVATPARGTLMGKVRSPSSHHAQRVNAIAAGYVPMVHATADT